MAAGLLAAIPGLQQELGYQPYPGTLNSRLERPPVLSGGIKIGTATFFPVRIERNGLVVHGHIVRWKGDTRRSSVELVAPTKLRDALQLSDRDFVQVFFPGELVMGLQKQNKYLRNKDTGVVVGFNEELSKMPFMEPYSFSQEPDEGADDGKKDTKPPEPPIMGEDDLDAILEHIRPLKKKAEVEKVGLDTFGLTFESGSAVAEMKKQIRAAVAEAKKALEAK